MPPRWSHRSRRRSARCRFGPGSWNAIAATKPREYIHELNGRRELNLSLHQMLGVATNIQGTAAELQAAGTILPPAPSLNDLIGQSEYFGRDCQPQSVGGLEVDEQQEFRRLLDRQVGRLGAFQDLIDMMRGAPE